MKELPVRTWYIVHANCDCSSDTYARKSRPGKGAWSSIRCRYCRQSLGVMSWDLFATVRARTEFEAMDVYQKQRAAQQQAEKEKL